MLAPSLQPTDRRIVSVIQRERLRMRAEFEEVIAGARQTIAQSQAFKGRDTPQSTKLLMNMRETMALQISLLELLESEVRADEGRTVR